MSPYPALFVALVGYTTDRELHPAPKVKHYIRKDYTAISPDEKALSAIAIGNLMKILLSVSLLSFDDAPDQAILEAGSILYPRQIAKNKA
jgi:hypothetical protein